MGYNEDHTKLVTSYFGTAAVKEKQKCTEALVYGTYKTYGTYIPNSDQRVFNL